MPAAVLACLRRRHAIPPLYACTCQDKTKLFGRSVLDSSGPNAFDPEGFLGFVRGRVAAADATVLAYLAESLHSLRRGTLVASAVMLGIAAERVFLLLSESLHAALSNAKERKDFGALLERFPMKPKLALTTSVKSMVARTRSWSARAPHASQKFFHLVEHSLQATARSAASRRIYRMSRPRD